MIIHNLKKKLEARKRRWANELHDVLWAYQTTPRHVTGESMFLLTFGTEALILVEIGATTLQRQLSFENKDQNQEMLNNSLDAFDERMGLSTSSHDKLSTISCLILQLKSSFPNFQQRRLGAS